MWQTDLCFMILLTGANITVSIYSFVMMLFNMLEGFVWEKRFNVFWIFEGGRMSAIVTWGILILVNNALLIFDIIWFTKHL